MKCLVSGATGFIGGELCRQLAAREIPFTALSRGGALLADGTRTVAIDFESRSIDSRLLRGVDVVFHLAGIAHQQASQGSYERINHRATLALAKAAETAGVGCFIYLSSVKAMGPPFDDRARSEADCVAPHDAYGLSKLRAEQDLQATFSRSEMAVIVLRPALVYGPEPKGNLRSLRRAVRMGMPRPPEGGARSMVAVQDLVELMLQISVEPPAGVHTWIVCDGQRYSARNIYELMRCADGKGKGISWLPLWAWRFATSVVDGMRDRGANSTFSKMFGTELYSSASVLEAIPWQPRLSLSDIVGDLMAAPENKL